MLIYQCYDVRINGREVYRNLMGDLQKNLRQTEDRSKIALEYAGNLKCTVCFFSIRRPFSLSWQP